MFDFFKPVLSDKSIMRYNKRGLLIEGDINPVQLQPNSVDLTLAGTYKKLVNNYQNTRFINKDNVSDGMVDIKNEIRYIGGEFTKHWYENRPNVYILEPGEFVLMASKEILNIPNGILSFVQGRSSIARLGIQTEQAGLIDAGFRGTITFEVFNQTNYQIILYEGMRIAQVYFFKAQKAKSPYGSKDKGSKYYGQINATGSSIHLDN